MYIRESWQAIRELQEQIQSSRNKFEQCSGVCVDKQESWFFGSKTVNA